MHLEGYPLAFTPKHLSEAIFNRDMSATHGPHYLVVKLLPGGRPTPNARGAPLIHSFFKSIRKCSFILQGLTQYLFLLFKWYHAILIFISVNYFKITRNPFDKSAHKITRNPFYSPINLLRLPIILPINYWKCPWIGALLRAQYWEQ